MRVILDYMKYPVLAWAAGFLAPHISLPISMLLMVSIIVIALRLDGEI